MTQQDQAFGTNCKGKQRKFTRACAYAQSCQTLRCSHIQRRELDEGSDEILDL